MGVEPSCLLTLVDEYRDFRLGPDADLVASKTMLVETFVADRERVPDLPVRPAPGRVLLHGHCQQKALVGTAGTVAASVGSKAWRSASSTPDAAGWQARSGTSLAITT